MLYTCITPPRDPYPAQPVSRAILFQELLSLVDLGRQVRTPAAVGVIQEHQRPVRLADLVFRNGSLAARSVSEPRHIGEDQGSPG